MKCFHLTIGGLPAVIAAVGLALTGCAEGTTDRDVAKAKEKVQDREREAAETRRDAMRDVEDTKRDAQPQTVNKPVLNDDIIDAQRKAQDRITDANRDVQDAKAELARMQNELRTARTRDEYVSIVQQRLDSAETRIDQLEAQVSSTEGPAKQTLENRIKALNGHHDNAEDALGKLKSADLATWETHRAAVDAALQEMMNGLNAGR